MKALPYIYAGLGIAAAAVGLAVAWKVKKTGAAVVDAAAEVLQEVNPMNPDNAIKRGVDKVVQAATGEPEATLGGKVWEWAPWNWSRVREENRISDPVVLPPKPTAAQEAAALGELGINTDLPAETMNGIQSTPFWYGAP